MRTRAEGDDKILYKFENEKGIPVPPSKMDYQIKPKLRPYLTIDELKKPLPAPNYKPLND